MNQQIPKGIVWVALGLALSLIALTSLVVAGIVTGRVFALLCLAVSIASGVAFYRLLKNAVLPSEEVDLATGTGTTSRGWLCYICGIVFPLMYLLLVRRDRQDPFLRFHCIQCLLLFTLATPVKYWQSHHVSNAAEIALTVLIVSWLVAMIQARRGHLFKLPVLGNVAERLASKGQPASV